MSTGIVRTIVKIDEEKCDGCGACVPSCAEGAIRVIGGKARITNERHCDGLGHCLGTCPRGAIRLEHRRAAAFDPPAVCPGTAGAPEAGEQGAARLRLRPWPVKLALLPAASPLWDDAHVMIAADCVACTMPGFHARLLGSRMLAIGCPKFDDVGAHVGKLAEVFRHHAVRSVTVARMEVPCCATLLRAVRAALDRAGRSEVSLGDVVVGVSGEILAGPEERSESGPEDEHR